jgi:hypothetical protein
MYKVRIAMSANIPYPMPIERKVLDCCGITGRILFPRHATRYSYVKAIMAIENGMNLPYWFPNKMKEGGKE